MCLSGRTTTQLTSTTEEVRIDIHRQTWGTTLSWYWYWTRSVIFYFWLLWSEACLRLRSVLLMGMSPLYLNNILWESDLYTCVDCDFFPHVSRWRVVLFPAAILGPSRYTKCSIFLNFFLIYEQSQWGKVWSRLYLILSLTCGLIWFIGMGLCKSEICFVVGGCCTITFRSYFIKLFMSYHFFLFSKFGQLCYLSSYHRMTYREIIVVVCVWYTCHWIIGDLALKVGSFRKEWTHLHQFSHPEKDVKMIIVSLIVITSFNIVISIMCPAF